MLEFWVLLLFVGTPLGMGLRTGRSRVALVPGVSLVAAVVNYVRNPPAGTDEVDVLPGLWVALSIAGILVALGGAAVARRVGHRDGDVS
jgi:hypothetical protein